ncbi:hypothetical protein [Nocardioides gilvus]|uniref:hypothetical protein n=1 Tax=Nocardioides gilvus TaxID=1735589 RepID=UPI000D741F9C|nr:hypothetical protein [Nocardioides gilvus]
MTWNWVRLSDEVRRLKLPSGEYSVGRIGYGLSRDHSSTADRVELLVTETGWRRLKERGWGERGRDTLRHPSDRSLSAHLVELEDVRHEILEVDGVPVVGVEPDPPAAPRSTWGERFSTAMTGAALALVIGAIAYGFTVFEPSPEPGTMWQHLAFKTTKVEATVESWHEAGTCQGAETWDTSPRIDMVYSWIDDGSSVVRSYTGCGASTDSPQDIWVTAEGDVASQHSPWADHFWPALIVCLVPLAFLIDPVSVRFRRWRRRRSQA